MANKKTAYGDNAFVDRDVITVDEFYRGLNIRVIEQSDDGQPFRHSVGDHIVLYVFRDLVKESHIYASGAAVLFRALFTIGAIARTYVVLAAYHKVRSRRRIDVSADQRLRNDFDGFFFGIAKLPVVPQIAVS